MAQHLPRIALVLHGFPPHERTGVENHVECLARSLAALDVEVEVFVACGDRSHRELETWREERDGFAITRVAAHRSPADAREALDRPGMARVFGAWLDERKIGLVHFHHVVKLGVGLIHEASRRGLRVVYTAHDFYAVSSRYTLLAPDLTPIEPGDLEAEVRADLALAFLDRIERLGDHHGTVLAEQLDADERETLDAILHGDPGRASVSRAEIRAAAELRRELELRRREAFGRVDLFLSPTQLVAATLSRAGFAGARIQLDPYGIDLEPFKKGVEPLHRSIDTDAARSDSKPVAFGYLGGLLKHKGVHVLFDAYAGLDVDATLRVFGDSRDRAYVELLQRRAERSGAELRGAYDVSDVARCLAEIDVLVVPSVWPENAPFVIREAFAARRPVIASRVGALAESVRDGIDGLLVDPGDARALGAAMERVVREDGLRAKLARAIRPVHSIREQAAALVERYRELVREKPSTRSATLPAHLVPFAARVKQLSDLAPEELVGRVLTGLGDLGRMLLGTESSTPAHLARAWTMEGSIADTLDAWERERTWLRDVVEEQRHGSESLLERTRWLTASLEARTSELTELTRANAELLQRSTWLSEGHETAKREVEWLRSTLETKTKETDWLEQTLADKGALADDLRTKLVEKTAEVDWLRSQLEAQRGRVLAEEHRAAEAERAVVELEKQREESDHARASLERERDWQRGLVVERDRELAWRRETEESLERAEAQAKSELAELGTRLTELGARLVALEDELRWRRSEMQVVQNAIRGKLLLFVTRDLRWRARHWPSGAEGPRDPEGTA